MPFLKMMHLPNIFYFLNTQNDCFRRDTDRGKPLSLRPLSASFIVTYAYLNCITYLTVMHYHSFGRLGKRRGIGPLLRGVLKGTNPWEGCTGSLSGDSEDGLTWLVCDNGLVARNGKRCWVVSRESCNSKEE